MATDIYCIGKNYEPKKIPSEIPVIVKDSNLSSSQKLITIKLLSFIYYNAFNLIRLPFDVIDKWQECRSHQDRSKSINFLIDKGFIKVYRYYSRKEKRANTYKVILTGMKRISANSRFTYRSSYEALKGLKPPNKRQIFTGMTKPAEQCLKGFRLYIKPLEALKITNTLTDIEEKSRKWKAFLSTGVVTGWNKPSFRTDKTYKRISTYKPNLQGLPKIYRNSLVIPEARFDVDYTSQHLYIAMGLNHGSFIPEAWECLELATNLNKDFIKSIVNPYYFGQSTESFIADKLNIDGNINVFKRINIVKNILSDKSNPLHLRAIYYNEKYKLVIRELTKMKAQRPEKPEELLKTGTRIMEAVLATSNCNEKLFPIYDGMITNKSQTAKNLQDRMPKLAKRECNIPIPVKVTNLQIVAV